MELKESIEFEYWTHLIINVPSCTKFYCEGMHQISFNVQGIKVTFEKSLLKMFGTTVQNFEGENIVDFKQVLSLIKKNLAT